MDNELIELIYSWLYHNEKLRLITSYLYKHTELFEKKYEHEFNHDLYNFFAGKITKGNRNTNSLYKLLTEKQIAKLSYLKLMERSINL